jgi:hypothetical protein
MKRLLCALSIMAALASCTYPTALSALDAAPGQVSGGTVTLPAVGTTTATPGVGTVTTTAPAIGTVTTTTTTGVTVPWGDFVSSIAKGAQEVLALILMGVVTLVVGMVPAWIQNIVRPFVLTMRKDQLFEKLAATIVGGTAGAVAGKTATIPIANKMVRDLVQMALDRGGPAVIAFAGGHTEALAEKALAALQEKGVIPASYSLDHAKAAVADVEVPAK